MTNGESSAPDLTILSTQGVRDFFRELLAAAIAHQRAHVQEDTCAYLVSLLTGFLETESLFQRVEGDLQLRPLALMLKDALDEEGPMRRAHLRKLGDTSLFVSGFLPESLERSAVGVDYYISMGERAYDALGGSVARSGRSVGRAGRADGQLVTRSVFEELAAKFKQLVDLLNEVSERTWLATNAGMLRLYDRFLQTGSVRLATLLRGRGMLVPVPIPAVRGGRPQ